MFCSFSPSGPFPLGKRATKISGDFFYFHLKLWKVLTQPQLPANNFSRTSRSKKISSSLKVTLKITWIATERLVFVCLYQSVTVPRIFLVPLLFSGTIFFLVTVPSKKEQNTWEREFLGCHTLVFSCVRREKQLCLSGAHFSRSAPAAVALRQSKSSQRQCSGAACHCTVSARHRLILGLLF